MFSIINLIKEGLVFQIPNDEWWSTPIREGKKAQMQMEAGKKSASIHKETRQQRRAEKRASTKGRKK